MEKKIITHYKWENCHFMVERSGVSKQSKLTGIIMGQFDTKHQ